MKLTESPLFDNEYVRKNITVVFDDKFEYATIFNGMEKITVDAGFFKDVVRVVERAVDSLGEEDRDLVEKIMWNIGSTALSEPFDKDEFAELI